MDRPENTKKFPPTLEQAAQPAPATSTEPAGIGPTAEATQPLPTALSETIDQCAVPLPGTLTQTERPKTDAGLPNIPGYELLGVLGRGGMGVVYKARQISLKRLVALKMIRAGAHAGPDEVSRFRLEAEAVARLQHPNIVQIHEIGENDGCPYFSLEYVDGGSLARRLAGKALSAGEAAALAETLARAMHYSHQRGVIHRDLKPANVLLVSCGAVNSERAAGLPLTPHDSSLTPKIADFGLAKQLEGEAGQTRSGAILGTANYMAPEQAEGRIRDIGPLTDVYALGAILYEMLTSQPPFRASSHLQTLMQVRFQEPVPQSRWQPKVPRDLETICLKALAKEPAGRYTSALALAQDLERFRAGESILARREGTPRKLWRKVRRRPVTVGLVVLASLTMVPAGYLSYREFSNRRVNALINGIQLGLNAPELSAAYLERLEPLIDRLDQVAPAEAAQARRRLYQVFSEQIDKRLGEPYLGSEDFSKIDQALAVLESRAPELANASRKLYKQRRSNWEPIFELTAGSPDKVPRVFDPSATEILDGKLLPKAPPNVKQAGPILTRLVSEGHVELIAVFGTSWTTASELGLLLNAADGKGYAFLLRVPAADRSRPKAMAGSFQEVKRAGGLVHLQLARNGKLLREQAVSVADLPNDTLEMQARREGDRLLFQVKGLAPVKFQDGFPLSTNSPGVFGLYWPGGISLQSLEARHKALSPLPSPLERGDSWYARGPEHYAEALTAYQEQAAPAGASELGQEARYKAALCQAELQHYSDAVALLQPLTTEAGPRWPLLAQGLLLLVYLRQGMLTEADDLLEHLTRPRLTPGSEITEGLSARSRLEELAALVPDEMIQDIWKAGFRKYSGLNILRFDPRNVNRLDRLVSFFDYLHFDPQEQLLAKLALGLAYCFGDRYRDAVRHFAETLRRDRELAYELNLHVALIDIYCYALRQNGAAQAALAVVNQELLQPPSRYRESASFLLIARARIHAGLKEWAQADRDVDEFFRLVQIQRMPYYHFAQACLLRGFIQEQRGDLRGAEQSWRRGLYKNFTHGKKQEPVASLLRVSGLLNVGWGFLLASLANDLSDADANALLMELDPYLNPDASVAGQRDFLQQFLPTHILRSMWRTPAGHELARRIVFHEVRIQEAMRDGVAQVAVEIARHGAFRGVLTPDQESVLRALGKAGYTTYFAAKPRDPLQDAQVLAMYNIWQDHPFLPGTSLPLAPG